MLSLRPTVSLALLFTLCILLVTANAGSDKPSDRCKPCVNNIQQCAKVSERKTLH